MPKAIFRTIKPSAGTPTVSRSKFSEAARTVTQEGTVFVVETRNRSAAAKRSGAVKRGAAAKRGAAVKTQSGKRSASATKEVVLLQHSVIRPPAEAKAPAQRSGTQAR